MVENWAKWYGTEGISLNWAGVDQGYIGTIVITSQKREIPSLQQLVEVVNCIEPDALASICATLLEDPIGTIGQGGMPDLFIWKPNDRKAMCVEVKSDKDKLQFNQIACINMLSSANFEVRCLKVDEN